MLKLLMDADCLIKITKAGLKELVVKSCKVVVPKIVEEEIVVNGKKHNCPDALVVEKNITDKAITVLRGRKKFKKGDDALQDLYLKTQYDAVATDDAKLIRRFKAQNIPFIVPGLIFYKILGMRVINRAQALKALEDLSEYISEDEFTTVQLLMEEIK